MDVVLKERLCLREFMATFVCRSSRALTRSAKAEQIIRSYLVSRTCAQLGGRIEFVGRAFAGEGDALAGCRAVA